MRRSVFSVFVLLPCALFIPDRMSAQLHKQWCNKTNSGFIGVRGFGFVSGGRARLAKYVYACPQRIKICRILPPQYPVRGFEHIPPKEKNAEMQN